MRTIHLAALLTVALAPLPALDLSASGMASSAIGDTSLLVQDKPQNVSGDWALTVETAAGTGNPSVSFKQDGETLTGTYSSQLFGEQKVTGTIKGNAITFGFTGSIEGNTLQVTYTGTVDKDTMKGKVTLGDLGEGTFTGKKK
jgi:hypothetical protein